MNTRDISNQRALLSAEPRELEINAGGIKILALISKVYGMYVMCINQDNIPNNVRIETTITGTHRDATIQRFKRKLCILIENSPKI